MRWQSVSERSGWRRTKTASMVSTPNSTHGHIPLLDGTDDLDLRSLSKNLKIQVARSGGAAGQLAEPRQGAPMGKTRPMPVV